MKKLLIVVDYQKDFVDGALGFPGAEGLDGPIARRIAEYRAAGNDVASPMTPTAGTMPAPRRGAGSPSPTV